MKLFDYGSPENRVSHDYYATPEHVVPFFLQHANVESAKNILDIGCGDGVWGKAVRKVNPYANITGIDIQAFEKSDAYDQWIVEQDYLKWNTPLKFDLVVSNPPFKYWRNIVHKAMNELIDGGYLSLFLRLQCLESKKSADIFAKYPLKAVLVSVSRVPFLLKNGGVGNKSAYAQYIWQKGWDGDTIVKWIDWKGVNNENRSS